MKSARFFKSLSWLLILNMLVKPAWIFFIDRQVQNIVGYEEYGKYFAILNLSYVLYFLLDVGISNMLNQRMANHLPVNILQLLRIKTLLLFLYIIVLSFVGWLSGISYWSVLLLVIAVQALTSLLVFFRSIVTANQYFGADAWFSVVDKLLMIIFCGSIIYGSFFGKISLVVFLQIQVACTLVTVLISLFFILKNKLILAGRKENMRSIIRQVLPFAMIILLMSMHYRLDGFLLERMHSNGALEAGIYASAYRLLDAGNMVGYLASSFLVAFVARHLNEKEPMQEAIFNTRHLLMFCSLGAASFVIIFASWLQQLLYHSNTGYNTLVIQLSIASYPAYCLVHVYGSVLTGAAKLKEFITILIFSMLINIVINIVLIPLQGALGCCIAALVSQYFCGIATMMASTKTLAISYNSRSILIYVLSALLLTIFFYFSRNLLINVWIVLAIAIVLSMLLLVTQLSFFKRKFISFR